jgi:uncharacterized protein (DUF983 family)
MNGVDARPRIRLQWVLPLAFILITGGLLALSSYYNECRDITPWSETCVPLPELIASLINGPGLCSDCALQYEYFPSEYSIARLIGVFLFWLWVGWLLDKHQDIVRTHTPRTTWAHLLTYVPWIVLCAVRVYGTVRHDRLSMAYALMLSRQSGILVLLQATGKIWIERAEIGWLLLLLAYLAKDMFRLIGREKTATA